jgi:hypothetical protein
MLQHIEVKDLFNTEKLAELQEECEVMKMNGFTETRRRLSNSWRFLDRAARNKASWTCLDIGLQIKKYLLANPDKARNFNHYSIYH